MKKEYIVNSFTFLDENSTKIILRKYLDACIELPGGDRPIRGTGLNSSKTWNKNKIKVAVVFFRNQPRHWPNGIKKREKKKKEENEKETN